MSERHCRDCKFSGWDPDGPYCAHGDVLKVSQFGLSLSSGKLALICPAPEHPKFEAKEPTPRPEPRSDKAPRVVNAEREIALGRAATETLLKLSLELTAAESKGMSTEGQMNEIVWPTLAAYREKLASMGVKSKDSRRLAIGSFEVGRPSGGAYGRETCDWKPSEFPLFEKT